MSGLCRILSSLTAKIVMKTAPTPSAAVVPVRSQFTKSGIPQKYFKMRSKDHEKYGGNPHQPHKLHIVMRVRSFVRRPYWEKKLVSDLGLRKLHDPVIHKNIPGVNFKLRAIKHLVRIQPLKTPFGLPTEEDMADTYINTKGELIIHRLLQPVKPKAIEPEHGPKSGE